MLYYSPYFISSRREVFYKKGAVKNFPKFRGKQLVLETLFNKVAGLLSAILSEKRLQHRCFTANYLEIFRTPILKNNYKRLLLLFIILLSAQMLFSTLGFLSPFMTTYLSCIKVQHSLPPL